MKPTQKHHLKRSETLQTSFSILHVQILLWSQVVGVFLQLQTKVSGWWGSLVTSFVPCHSFNCMLCYFIFPLLTQRSESSRPRKARLDPASVTLPTRTGTPAVLMWCSLLDFTNHRSTLTRFLLGPAGPTVVDTHRFSLRGLISWSIKVDEFFWFS